MLCAAGAGSCDFVGKCAAFVQGRFPRPAGLLAPGTKRGARNTQDKVM